MHASVLLNQQVNAWKHIWFGAESGNSNLMMTTQWVGNGYQ